MRFQDMTPSQQNRMRQAFRQAVAESFTWRGLRRILNEDFTPEMAWLCGFASAFSVFMIAIELVLP